MQSTQEIVNQISGSLTQTVAIAAGTATDTVVKAAPGRLFRVLVTTSDSNPLTIHDNDEEGSGTVIGCLPANPGVGETYEFDMPASNGITVAGHADNPGITISFA